MDQLTIYTKEDISRLLHVREGETRIGERIRTVPSHGWESRLSEMQAPFVLLGIPEDIGVRANGGIGGTHTLWLPAFEALLNMQDTPELSGEDIIVLGSFDFSSWMSETQGKNGAELRRFVSMVDEVVYPVIRAVVKAGKVPVILGGGHNNAYPILKGVSLAKGQAVHCINLDAHSDYRMLEGRHSGNGFRYARKEGFLERYAMVGLHKSYNSFSVMQVLDADPGLRYITYEDIFLLKKRTFSEALEDAVRFTDPGTTGVELDMDAISGALSSAVTPAGISVTAAREYIYTCAAMRDPAYFHLAEGAIALADGRKDPATAKLAACLLTDFIRARKYFMSTKYA